MGAVVRRELDHLARIAARRVVLDHRGPAVPVDHHLGHQAIVVRVRDSRAGQHSLGRICGERRVRHARGAVVEVIVADAVDVGGVVRPWCLDLVDIAVRSDLRVTRKQVLDADRAHTRTRLVLFRADMSIRGRRRRAAVDPAAADLAEVDVVVVDRDGAAWIDEAPGRAPRALRDQEPTGQASRDCDGGDTPPQRSYQPKPSIPRVKPATIPPSQPARRATGT